MGATFSRIKNWTQEVLTHADLNAEIDNILNNLTPSGVDDYSATVAQMQTATDPGESGSESQATSLAGELARLRFAIKEIKGSNISYWYQSGITSLYDLNTAIGGGLNPNRLISGRMRATSAFPIFLVPDGAAKTIKLDGTPTNFSYYVNGVQCSITADVTLTGLTAAPSSNNTCSINDAAATGQLWTKSMGENGTSIPVDGMGSSISGLIGTFAAFSLYNGASTEYFTAYIESSTSLTKARRGFFFDSTDAPVPRIAYSDNNEVKLMKLTYVFATAAGALTATYGNLSWGKDQPSSPAVGDFWYDTDNSTWMVYSIGSWGSASATLVGACLQTTAACVAARSLEFQANYQNLNTFELIASTNTQVKTKYGRAQANVWGNLIKTDEAIYTWDITADLESGVTEGASTTYYAYLTEEGDKILSDVRPYDRTGDLGGWYHTHHSWRCIGSAFNNGSSNLAETDSYYHSSPAAKDLPEVKTATQSIEILDRIIRLDTSASAFATVLPSASMWRGSVLRMIKTSADFNAVTVSHAGTAATTLNTLNEFLTMYSDGTVVSVLERRIPGLWTAYTPTTNRTGVTVTGFWFRSGDSIRCRYYFLWGSTSASTATDVSPPTGLTIDTTKLLITTTLRQPVGPIGMFHDPAGGTTQFLYYPVYKNTTTISHKYVRSPDGASIIFTDVSSSAPVGETATMTMNGEFLVPIVGWGS